MKKITTLVLAVLLAFGATTAAEAQSANVSSYNWSGYVSDTGTSYTSVSGSWVVPQVTSGGNPSADATWVGIGGVKSTDLIQAGTEAIIQNGQTVYEPWYEILPDNATAIPVSIKPGDSVNVSVSQQSPGIWLISFKDTSSGGTYSKTVSYSSSLSSAEWIEEMPAAGNGTFIPIDGFGTVQFNGGQTVENGDQISISQSAAFVMNMLNTNQQPLTAVTNLGSDGESFSVSRTTNAVTSSGSYGVGFASGRGHSRVGHGVQGFTPGAAGTRTGPTASTTTYSASGSGFARRIMRAFGQQASSFSIPIPSQMTSGTYTFSGPNGWNITFSF